MSKPEKREKKETKSSVRGVILDKGEVVLSKTIFGAMMSAEKIILKAKEKAQQLLNNAQEEKKTIYEGARREGREIGKAEMTGMLSAAAAQAERLRQRAGDQMIQLATQMAARILEEELACRPERIQLLARKALKEAKWAQWVRIKANPEDIEMLEKGKKEFLTFLSNVNELSISADPKVPRGGCIIETEAGEVDATLETQVSAMYGSLKKELEDE